MHYVIVGSAGEHRNGIPNHPGSSPGTAVHFSHPLGSRTASDSMKEYKNKSLSRPGDDLVLRDKSQLSRKKYDSDGRIA